MTDTKNSAPQDHAAATTEWPPLIQLGRTLGLFASVIKSGEPWTTTCQLEYDLANEAFRKVYAEMNVSAAPASQPNVTAKASDFDKIVSARKKHVDAVATYNARLKFVSKERQLGNRGLNVDPEFRAMSDAQSDYLQIVNELADAALSAAEGFTQS